MEIKKLWEGLNLPKCETCDKDCQGHLDYENLCANVNYLREYGEKNYNKNKDSFAELKNIIEEMKPNIFSFGCGLGLDYLGAKEIFGDDVKYYGIEKCNWAIKETDNYKNFQPQLPKTFKYADGMFLLTSVTDNIVLCFFNSLYSIAKNKKNFSEQLATALQNKKQFYILCDYTINKNYQIPNIENEVVESLLQKLSSKFQFKKLSILDGKGMLIIATK